MTSTPDTEAEIPLILIPLREGWLPYPLVEIREVVNAEGGGGQATAQGCEVDLRNLGETVRVVGDRSGITVSLDVSGPGGGPLVFESERLGSRARSLSDGIIRCVDPAGALACKQTKLKICRLKRETAPVYDDLAYDNESELGSIVKRQPAEGVRAF
ncbi:uncharacterized protein TRIVIDRAFT_222096 [Trichoderma virens Gv29-8]|uniref:TRAPPC10/Trs130 C-terminal domain-containing protein n=1 Tax=Hypocrea virens (strain Gv29-8 / FGSC 10586) TaxID=413071 RepID=G9MRW5_HYPVG|nr:uncharacterized protein TRIVIDRAFT_222096 [Trichoderma virens Gv29-8]EHK22833.1 hypothetical protein TRIVIDRAFT_222096 [Trichoderma virens Gv29-8]UKZ47888.1 hypothetical protein TrVGV298_002122 [Trichoderma virens]